MMGRPCWPNAGPTGGAGVASPALRFSLRMVPFSQSNSKINPPAGGQKSKLYLCLIF